MVSRLAKRLNDVKLRDKILVGFLLFMVLPQVLLVGLVFRELRESTLREALAQAEAGVGRLESQTLEVLEVGRKIAGRVATDKRLETLVTTAYPEPLDVFRAYHGFDTFQLFTDLAPEVVGIQAYIDNPTLLDNWEVRVLDSKIRNQFWYQASKAHPTLTGWFSWKDETKAPTARVSLVRFLRFGPERREAVLVVDLDASRLEALSVQEGFETLILDPNLVVIAASKPGLVGKPLAEERLLALVSFDSSGVFQRSYRGQKSTVFLRQLWPDASFNGLRIACIVSPQVILQSADRATWAGLLVVVLGALMSLGFLWVGYGQVARRLETLSSQLPLVAAGDFTRVLKVDGGDEIGQLTARFNTMIGDIRGLIAEVNEAHEAQNQLERAQGEIRLKMLASQINPHFLFNVLESIRMKAHLGGEREIASTVKLLGRLMRRNLEAGGDPIPVDEELENARCYLEIEKFRLEEKLTYTVDVPDDLRKVPILPLIIEPLVENAVVHGLEGQYGGGTVTVTIRRAGNLLEVEVADNGLGMDPARVPGLFDNPGRHVGLANIHQRLQLTYGPNFGLRVETEPSKGTRVWFQLPLAEEDTPWIE